MFATALIFGFLGSLHCAGMCGPITMVLPIENRNPWGKFSVIALYNVGRVITYALIGLLFGLFGMGIELAGLHQGVSLVVGALMVLSVLFPLVAPKTFKSSIANSAWMGWLRAKIRSLLSSKNSLGFLLLGIMNGLLPCGLVYVALAGALLTGGAIEGAIYMTLFGLGTIPMMAALPLAKGFMITKMKLNPSKILPIVTIVVGGLFVLRGLGMDIPYLSPHQDVMKLEQNTAADGETLPAPPKKSCH